MCRSVQTVPFAAPSSQDRRSLQLRSLLSRRPAQYWTTYSQQVQDRIDRAVQDVEYDLIMLEHSFVGYYRLPVGVPIVLDQQNVESEVLHRASEHDRSRIRRLFNLVEYKKYHSDEQRICRSVDLIMAASSLDREQMQNWSGVGECRVIPNGVDVHEFMLDSGPTGSNDIPSLLFTGPLHYAPNAEAVLFFGNNIWPLIKRRIPRAQWTIVGTNPPREILQLTESDGVHAVGFVPDVRPYLMATEVVIVPLHIGGGTRLKILEAMAMQCPVVTTSLGCEGLDVTDGREVLIADSPSEFADRVVELLLDPAKRQVMGQAGRRLAEQHYDWHIIGVLAEDALLHVLESRKP